MDTIAQALLTELLPAIRQAVRDELMAYILPKSNNEAGKPMNVTQAAAFLDRPVATLYWLVNKSEIPHIKKGRRLYFLKEDLITWVESGKVKSKAELVVEANEMLTGKSKKLNQK